jgi:hypothetical protein
MAATLGLLGLAAIVGYVVLALALGGRFAVPIGMIGAGAAALALRGPLGQAIARRLDGSDPPAEAIPEQLMAELDEVRGRLAELEERVDFSERLLAQQSRVPER